MATNTLLPLQCKFNTLEACMFGFYSEDEIRKLSCCEVKEPKGISVLQLGESNGLHDPRMGTLSTSQQEMCPICYNNHYHCPGHIGHIRLRVPIYNPTIFKFVDQILTRKCYNCHCLLYDDNTIEVIQHKLKTLEKGYIFNINSIENDINLLEEAYSQKVTKQLFDNSLTKKKLKIKKKNKKKKSKKKLKKHKRHKKKKWRSQFEDDESDSDSDSDPESELGINIMSSSDDEDIGNDENNDEEKNAASSKPINLDFLDEGIMKATRQSVLKLRWRLFEFSQPIICYLLFVICSSIKGVLCVCNNTD